MTNYPEAQVQATPQAPLDGPLFVTVEKAAALMNVSKNTMYNAVRAGQVPAGRVGRQYRISLQALKAWGQDGNLPPATHRKLS